MQPAAKPSPPAQPEAPSPQVAAPQAAPPPVAPQAPAPTPPGAGFAEPEFAPSALPPQRAGSSAELQAAQTRPAPSADLQGADFSPRAQAAPLSQPPPPQPRAVAPAPGQAGRVAAEADNPLARSFADEEPKTPENLSFDFGDDPGEQHQMGEAEMGEAAAPEDRYDRWQVGDPEAEPIQPRMTPEMSRYQARRAAIAQAGRRVERPAPAPADNDDRERLRSSTFFLALFALMVIGFGALTFMLGISPSLSRGLLSRLPVIGGEFSAAAPGPNPVSLRDVHAEYRVLDNHRHALIVSGRAENRGAEPLHAIQVGVSLVDRDQHPVVTQAVFCGDLVSPKIVSQMTAHELQFFQKLAPPRNFVLKSGDSTPFFVMFVNPPPGVANFEISILKAEPASGDAAESAGI
jgi:hypothetical protein